MTFSCPHLTKSRLQLDFGSSLPSSPGPLHSWTLEGGIYGKRLPTFIIAETTRVEGQGQANMLGQEVVVLCQQCNPWDGDFTNTGSSQEAK